MSNGLTRVRRIHAQAAAGQPLDQTDLEHLATALGSYLSREAQTLDAAFGVQPKWGERPWWTVEAKNRRDAILADLDRMMFGDMDVTVSAANMLALATKHRQRKPDLPPVAAGLLDELGRSGSALPGKRQLATIISDGRRAAGVEIRDCLNFTQEISSGSPLY